MASASERNKEPILNVLRGLISQHTTGNALEIASGYGTHVIHFASHFKNILWQPTDVEPSALNYINQNVSQSRLTNVKTAVFVDASKPLTDWTEDVKCRLYDLIVCINMIHITPFECTEGLFSAAGLLLKDTGILITYGPYAVNGVLKPQSNIDFDKYLKRQNPTWGVKDISDLKVLAEKNGLSLTQTFEMPSNNKTLVFRKMC
ncbi:UPF0585 protein C16orf13-like protein [Leptotrombidium deliense]|uniref:UPF0585 protein C16orf13-like protein n=1 Tax=Leptotrombidium deliense TaxID=299467 RepID=A0A443SRY1_9ACAR|nr:UPF0585 protein C16orf13-like protein [Leptotrombidium deliense]